MNSPRALRASIACVLVALPAFAAAQSSPAAAADAGAAKPAPPAWLTPRVYPDVPPAKARRLELVDVPRATGPKRVLFNGRNLDGFEPWLGYRLPLNFFSHGDAAPIGRAGIGEVFNVVSEDGKPAIQITGNPQGALLTPDLGGYHLSLEYKWGKAGADGGHNSGVLYNSYGEAGGFLGTWMTSIEYEVQPGNTGMLVPVGPTLHMTTELGKDEKGNYVYMPGGKRTEVGMPTFVHNPRDADRPAGEWNRLELYVVGNGSVHVVNGVPVLALSDITVTDADGVVRPLTHGRIQLQSELGEVFYRNITIEPVKSLPRVVARD